MLGVVSLHIIGNGGVLKAPNSEFGFYINNYIETIFYCAVNVFALLTGYLSINKRRTFGRAVDLFFTVLFYSFLITAISVVAGSKWSFTGIIKSLFPYFDDSLWYVNCILPVIILEPIINKMLHSLTRNNHKNLCVILVFLFSIVPSFAKHDFFGFNKGYSFSWLLTLYIIGAYIRKYDVKGLRKKVAIFLLMLLPTVLTGMNYVLDNLRGAHHTMYLVTYISPFVLAEAILFLLVFKDVESDANNKLLQVLSVSSFDVYVIHGHPYIMWVLISGAFAWVANFSVWVQPIIIFVCACLIYLSCVLFGQIRLFAFKSLKISQMCSAIEDRVNLFDWD